MPRGCFTIQKLKSKNINGLVSFTKLCFYFWLTFSLVFFQVDNHEVKKGKNLKVNMSTPNLRLFVGNIPKNKSKDEILAEFAKITSKYVMQRVIACLFHCSWITMK